jgi:site-specific DNA-methyltransferase (adenine-specific)
MQLKTTQNAPRKVYSLVPMQDFSRPWTDEDLYKKYGLTEEEITFIESMVRPREEKENIREKENTSEEEDNG